ncbi:hypothetical protein OC834_005933 [Tilletia horrida]|uniref:Uncharacterized protein n=1 Tax=Tilletia horrida TaxID=155126 RepID=A0AAN6G933_9BASI|nr:hypothetical protein OC834_005933 [Tilletia horrida]KAK0524036.1 hypothetical protein OC842_005958 [Tilletia horrida]KAK0524743.1 hypothetical protein OC835_005831 [Tilletia horrida]KAK0560889.1 hypothetical protein OC844_003509 [Tilletia horrida]
MSSSVMDTVLPPSTAEANSDTMDPNSTSSAPAGGTGASPSLDPSAAVAAPTAGASVGAPTNGTLSDFQHNLLASGNILGGIPSARDTNPSATLFTAYLVFLVVLGLRSLFHKTNGAVDFRLFCFLIVRVATFGMRFGLSEDRWPEPEHGALIGQGILLLIGPLLLISPLLTIITNIASPTLDALKARADVERSTEGGSRRPGGGATFFLKHLPAIFQLIVGICAVLTIVVAFRFARALHGNKSAQREVRHIKAVTTFSLMAISVLTLIIIIVLWAKLMSVSPGEYFIGTNGRSRRSKGYKTQTFLATIVALSLAVCCMYRMIQAHVPLDSRVNKFVLFWGVYIAPETFVALLYTVYCFPHLPQDEVVIIPQMPGAEDGGSGSDSESLYKPGMRTLRTGSIASVARSASSSTAGSARYVHKP